MKNLYVLLTLLLFFSFNVLFAKNEMNHNLKQCGTKVPSQEWENVFQSQIKEYAKNYQSNSNQKNARTVITIPVIVHVIYYNNNTQQNITKAQIDSQFNILNRNFRGMSEFAGNIPNAFKSLNADVEIEWCPALIAPNGTVLAEPGIERISATSKGFSNPGIFGWETSYVSSTVKPSTIWNPELYCNIWIVPKMRSGFFEILGFATFPTMTTLEGLYGGNGSASTDGVVIAAPYFGKGGSTQAPYNNGGTTVHELGHWLGLRHIWGDDSCGIDYCDDTPTQLEENGGCPTFPHITCSNGPNGDMFMNYMDYTYDNCLSMFTPDQKERMQTAMTFGNLRAPLVNSPVCNTTTPATIANFKSTKSNGATCATNVTYNFTDNSIFNPISWSWTFEGGTPATSTVQNPTVSFTTPGLHQVTLTATNANGSSTITKSVNIVLVGNGTLPLNENFESGYFPPAGWTYLKRSSAGLPEANWDNISGVSGFGIGDYSMRYDNTTVDANKLKDDILTPYLDFTNITVAKLKFDVAYAPFFYDGQVGYDTIEVLLTDNCESTVTSIYKKGGEQLATFLPGLGEEFYPTSSQWRTDSITIPANFLNKSNVQVIFRNYGLYGHTVYIDNINLSTNAIPTGVQASFTASSASICAGESITFTNTSTTTGLDSVRWTIPGGTLTTSNSQTTVISQFNSAGNYTVTMIAYKGGVASSPYSTNIVVKAKPIVTVNSPSICNGQSATLTANGATTYSWSSSSDTDNSISVSPTATTTYTVTGTSNGCTSATATSTVTVKTTPTISVNSPSICNGESATLTANGATTYTWSSSSETDNSINVSPALTTSYTVTGTTDGCPSQTATATVTVNPTPTVTVNSPTICSGQSVTLTASGATTYNWSNSETSASISVSPTITTSYTVIGHTNGCPSAQTTSTVTVTSTAPTITITPSIATAICEGQSITLTAGGANEYVWSNNATATSITVSPTTTTSYSVTGSLTGCNLSGNQSYQVVVNDIPTETIITQSANSDTIYITGSTGTNYNWYINGVYSTSTNVPYLVASTGGVYSVKVANSNCQSDFSNTLTVTLTAIRDNNNWSNYLSVYPNPNNGNFNVSFNADKSEQIRINIFDMSGKQIFTEDLFIVKGDNIFNINIESLAKGIYTINLVGKDGIATKPLMVK